MNKYLNLPKEIYLICLGIIITNLGNYVFPLFTFITKEQFGWSEIAIANFLMFFAFAQIFGNIIGGKLIDVIGRKFVFVFFMLASGISYFMAGFAGDNANLLFFFLGIGMLFASIASPASGTMITDLTTSENRKEAFSLQYMAINVGFALGPLIGGFIYQYNYEWLFRLDGLTTMLFALIIFIFVHETKPATLETRNENEQAVEGSFLKALMKKPEIIIFSLIIVVFFIVFRQFSYSLPLFMNDLFGDKKGSLFYGTLMTINAVGVVILSPIIIHYTKNKLPSFNIFLGGIFYIVGFGFYAFVREYYFIAILTFVWTIGEVLISTYTSTYIANHSPISHRGRFNSLFSMIRKVGSLIGLPLAGMIIEGYNFPTLWLTMGITAMVASIFIFILYLSDLKSANI